MAVSQGPIVRTASGEQEQYRGFAQAQMRILKDYMRVAGLNTYSRIVTLDNGTVVVCQKCFAREDIFINVNGAHSETIVSEIMIPYFISRPRTENKNNGYSVQDIYVPLETGDIQNVNDPIGSKKIRALAEFGNTEKYPLDSDEKASAIIGIGPMPETRKFAPKKAGEFPIKEYRRGHLYGNIDWKGKNTLNAKGASNAPVLTWNGPTGRSLPFNVNEDISGFSKSDIVFSDGGTPKYTCFGPYVYEKGSIAFAAPKLSKMVYNGSEIDVHIDAEQKVLGAAYSYVTINDKTFKATVCIVVNHYEGVLGFYEEVWVNLGSKEYYDKDTNPLGWRNAGYVTCGRPTLCWFFNESGNKATQGAFEYTINIESVSASKVLVDVSADSVMTISKSETVDESNVSATASITHSGSWIIWSDYKGDQRVTGVISISGGDDSSLSVNSYSEVKDDVPYFMLGTDTCIFWIERNGSNTGWVAKSTGYCCPCNDKNEPGEWSGDGLVIDKNTGIFGGWTAACGTATITYKCGSKEVTIEERLPDGRWEVVSTCGTLSGFSKTLETGGSRITEYYLDQNISPNVQTDRTVRGYCSNPASGNCCDIVIVLATWFDPSLNFYTDCGGSQTGIVFTTQPQYYETGYYNCTGDYVTYTQVAHPAHLVYGRRIERWAC